MQFAQPIGFALSRPLLERLDKIARSKGLSRSSVARSFLIKGLAEYERSANPSGLLDADVAGLSRAWRPRGGKARP